ncbi:class I SAM-dependent methyltransferase [Roseateles sp. BYS180W]|uniref:Class I SAM-dependent methyltransferase n=1 Tax=Roseateles rivi TaxID=3299028 RepID=A0ABW7FS03_9BURK
MSEPIERWQSFYQDRQRPVPFFRPVPDENLVDWVPAGSTAGGARALDIGCGNGRNALFLARQGYEVLALDYSASAIAWARELTAEAAQGLTSGGLTLRQADVFNTELPSAGFELVCDSGCFHHLLPAQRQPYIDLIARVLRPGGLLSLVCFAPEGGSGLSDAQAQDSGSTGGGLGYDEALLRQLWSPAFDIQTLRRMHELDASAPCFGKAFLWALRGLRR